ncbi:MAG: DUF4261 domain-containing protein [Lawsonibacter sp.]|nr:DUF4261 domain-containing protein [Lawsonibacter sp.]
MGFLDKLKNKGREAEEKTAEPERKPQDLEGKWQPVYFMWLLFDREPQLPSPEAMQSALEKKYGPVDSLGTEESRAFAVPKYMAQFQDGQMPAQVVMFPPQPFVQEELGVLERSQLWNVPDGQELLSRATHKVLLSDMMAVMDYPKRCELLMDYMEAAVELFPDCLGVWFPHAWKLFAADYIRNHTIPREDRFVCFGVNVRFFNIQDSRDKVVDSLGMYAVGLPDVQYHFRDLDPNAVVDHAYNLCSYLFAHNAPIKGGETVDGLRDGRLCREVQWCCQYENALIAPKRELMDVCPGEYAAGGRG